MKIIKTKIKDLFIIKGKIFYDQRGFLREAYKKNIIKKNLIFAIVSKSKKNVLRGLHIQRKNPQDKYILVLKGKILDVVVDARKNSKTYGKYYKVILSDKNGKSFFIPKGFLHGFLGLEKENIVLYGCTNYRNKDSEVTVRWNDKNLNIKWPINKPLLSKKDKKGIKFSDLEK